MTQPNSIDANQLRKSFPIFEKRSLIYLDSAATSQKPKIVIDAVKKFYNEYNSNVHRSIYDISQEATEAYETAREKVAKFLNVDKVDSIIFTKGTTESMNLIAYSWVRHNLKKDDEILITEMEHHSNMVPWQLACKDVGAKLKIIPFEFDGTLKHPEKYFSKRTKLVSITHQSNVFGTINDIDKIINLAKKYNAISVIDAAQSVPHFPVDVKAIDCDFLAFSGHKMLGPTGVGVLYGKPELLENMNPFLGGGEMIRSVQLNESTWNDIPWKFEAGTPNIAQAIGLGVAVDFLNEIGMNNIHDYEKLITDYALNCLNEIDGITIYGNPPNRGGVITFNIKNIHSHDLAQILNDDKIAIRAGHHCAQPIMNKLNVSSTARASFYFYNTFDEIDLLCKSIKKAIKLFK